MTSVARTLLAIVSALTVVACSTTKFSSTWMSLDVVPVDYAGKKIAAVFLSQKEDTRRAAEDALAREITARGAQGVAGYTLVSTEALQDKERAKAKLREAGVEAVVVMRMTGKSQQVEYTPSVWTGPGYASLSDYSGWGPGPRHEPDPASTDTVVSIETLVYSLAQDKLIWGGVSKTFNPAKVDTFASELADAVAAELKSEGLIR